MPKYNYSLLREKISQKHMNKLYTYMITTMNQIQNPITNNILLPEIFCEKIQFSPRLKKSSNKHITYFLWNNPKHNKQQSPHHSNKITKHPTKPTTQSHDHYTKDCIHCHLFYRVTQCYIFLLLMLSFTKQKC